MVGEAAHAVGIQGLAEVAHQVSVEVDVVIDPARNEAQLQVAEQAWRIHTGVVDERVFQIVVPRVEEVVVHQEAVRTEVRVPEPSSNGDCDTT